MVKVRELWVFSLSSIFSVLRRVIKNNLSNREKRGSTQNHSSLLWDLNLTASLYFATSLTKYFTLLLLIKEITSSKTIPDVDEVTQQKTYSVLDLFRYESLRGMTLKLSVVLCIISMQFYIPVLMLDKFQLNMFLNGLVFSVSDLIATPACYCLIVYSRRRYLAFVSFSVMIVCSVIVVFIWSPYS